MTRDDQDLAVLLRWRAARAAEEAPPPPSARLLLDLARPWWERWPDRLRARAERLRAMPLAFGYAMTAAERQREAHPVPTLVVADDETDGGDVEAWSRVSYLSVHDGRLRLRFRLEGARGEAVQPGRAFEATFVLDGDESPRLAARAEQSQSGEYRIDTGLPDDLTDRWAGLKVTDRLPFRFVLHPAPDAG